mmetsp:Transcript_9524/g.29448  ORF Transcript_9524/g.29448 Transcript_9524/m.29448 type:complete len:237 (+) Transcript_9524:451-1161(+)
MKPMRPAAALFRARTAVMFFTAMSTRTQSSSVANERRKNRAMVRQTRLFNAVAPLTRCDTSSGTYLANRSLGENQSAKCCMCVRSAATLRQFVWISFSYAMTSGVIDVKKVSAFCADGRARFTVEKMSVMLAKRCSLTSTLVSAANAVTIGRICWTGSAAKLHSSWKPAATEMRTLGALSFASALTHANISLRSSMGTDAIRAGALKAHSLRMAASWLAHCRANSAKKKIQSLSAN